MMDTGPSSPNENRKSSFEKFVEAVEAYSEGVNRSLSLLVRLGKAVKDQVFFILFLIIFIALLRAVFWIHNNIPFL